MTNRNTPSGVRTDGNGRWTDYRRIHGPLLRGRRVITKVPIAFWVSVAWGPVFALGSASSSLGSALSSLGSALRTPSLHAQELPSGQEATQALLSGDYERAIELFEAGATSGSLALLDGLVTALHETGRYDDATSQAQAAVTRGMRGAEGLLGRALFAQGKIDEARAALRSASDNQPWSEQAKLHLGVLEYDHGDRDAAYELFDGFIDFYNGSNRLSSRDLTAVGTALSYLSRKEFALAHDAMRALDEAVAAGPPNHAAHLALGRLFIERYDPRQATEAYRAILVRNPQHAEALLGLARAAKLEGSGGASESLASALETNPNLVAAHVLQSQTHLIGGDDPKALEAVDRALATNPSNLEALATKAAILHLQGRGGEFQEIQSQISQLFPRPSHGFVVLAELSADRRKYQDALAFALTATRTDSLSWTGWGLTGINQVRLGQVDAGRVNLERAFTGDPFNLWFKNTLDLVDTFDQYRIVESEHFQFVLHESEADLLAPIIEPLAERAYREMSKRYGFSPSAPIRVEVYPRHADFSVRTVGLTGLGALGVSFGPALAMDSPSARSEGEFNWGSTLWHEIAHTFHLGLTNHEVPRWFSEGLAVHEQRKAAEGWGHQANPGFIQALASGKLRPVSELDRSFSHPRHPGEVLQGYYQASLVFEFIEKQYGFPAIVAMLRAYRDGADDARAFQVALNTSLTSFDGVFEDFMEERFDAAISSIGEGGGPEGLGEALTAAADLPAARAAVASAPSAWAPRMVLAQSQYRAEDFDNAKNHFEQALRLFPEYGGMDGAHWFLARIARTDGNLSEAESHLTALLGLNENHPAAIRLLTEVRAEQGNASGAATALESLAFVHPYDLDDHVRLAELFESEGSWNRAVAPRRAIVALDPVDRAGALYHLARSYFRAGNLRLARRQVLAALEVAPNYSEALELLLDIRSSGGTP